MATRRRRAPAPRTPRRPAPAGERIARDVLQRLIFGTFGQQRFTQDSPILPDVWLAYARSAPGGRQDLILTPHAKFTAGAVAQAVEWRIERYHSPPDDDDKRQLARQTAIAYNRSSVVARLTFDELMCIVVPMTSWWRTLPKSFTESISLRALLKDPGNRKKPMRDIASTPRDWAYLRFAAVAGFVAILPRLAPRTAKRLAAALADDGSTLGQLRLVVEGYLKLIENFEVSTYGPHDDAQIWNIASNRTTQVSLFESRATVKGDAASNVFPVKTDSIAWAVVDAGIDARHPAFCDLQRGSGGNGDDPALSRVVKTYDFAFLRTLLALQEREYETAGGRKVTISKRQEAEFDDLARRVRLGREIDWDILEPLMRVPHTGEYERPLQDHGTHVAGILAGNWPAKADDERPSLVGICPELKLYDLRVFDRHGRGDEFTIVAALQFVAHLNRNRDNPVLHGVNLSLSLRHEVTTYACGRTPICDESERLIGDGVVVVAAAGNEGFEERFGALGALYRGISITDPGNADAVITVGSTHRRDPHTYGVSYFSSRGPTGDGRRKPDIVAPGEKITAPTPNGSWKCMDGTSMAAPHVSGAAALLMARYPELIGRPRRIKEILCKTATDLGREGDFQGAGMVDILRALQSV